DTARIRLHMYQGAPLARTIYQPFQPIAAQLDLAGSRGQIEQFMGDLRQPVVGRIYNVPRNSDKKRRGVKVHHPLCVNSTPQRSKPSSCVRC
ncbi:MAG: hypothetical protein M3R61_10275, partial [Chloroflexota bacterium]|nr:hypothetical protein [Chloroflexota bacterium]